MKEIRSVNNPMIKELKKLHKKKQREEQQRYLLEGFHLVEEALKQNQPITAILIAERGQREWGNWLAEHFSGELYLVSEAVLTALSELPTPQGIVAVLPLTQAQTADLKGRWLLLDRVQDPGNVGTMIRTADAAGFAGVIVGRGSADLYSTKVLRSMQGSQFHLPILTMELSKAIALFKQKKTPVYGTELNEAAVDYRTVSPTSQLALVLGNEGQGVAAEILTLTDQNLYIPIYGQAESLNVGVAAGILMYHFVA